jgi:hypothetical protein
MARLLDGATFSLVATGWKPCRIADVKYVATASGANIGAPRISMQLKITEGAHEGENLFVSGMLAGKAARFARLKLEAIRPDLDWGDYEFPDDFNDAEGIARLREDLMGNDVWALVTHRLNPTTKKLTENVDTLHPADTDHEVEDDLDAAA